MIPVALNGMSDDFWRFSSPNPRLAPRHEITSEGYLVLGSNGSNACFGKYIGAPVSVEQDLHYEFKIGCTTEGMDFPSESLHVIISWSNADRAWVRRDYITPVQTGDSLSFVRTLHVPDGAAFCEIELAFKYSRIGSVIWNSCSMELTNPPRVRKARVASVFTKPGAEGLAEIDPYSAKDANLDAVLRAIDMVSKEKPDRALFSETMLSVGGVAFEVAAVTLDGPEVRKLGEKAKQYNMYIAISLSIVEEDVYYNCALLFDRSGEIVGVHKKLQLPLAEVEMGFTPGDEFKVFETDFGRVGMMICWDCAFPGVASELARRGAELLLVPSMWNSPIAASARSADNAVFLALSTPYHTDVPVRIFDPLGKEIANQSSGKDAGYCVADIELSHEYTVHWFSIGNALGECGPVLQNEARRHLYWGQC